MALTNFGICVFVSTEFITSITAVKLTKLKNSGTSGLNVISFLFEWKTLFYVFNIIILCQHDSTTKYGNNWNKLTFNSHSIYLTRCFEWFDENQNTIQSHINLKFTKLHRCQCIDIDPLTFRHVAFIVYSALWRKCFSSTKKPWSRRVWIIIVESSELNDIAEIKQKYCGNHHWEIWVDFNRKVELSQFSPFTRWFFNFWTPVGATQLID